MVTYILLICHWMKCSRSIIIVSVNSQNLLQYPSHVGSSSVLCLPRLVGNKIAADLCSTWQLSTVTSRNKQRAWTKKYKRGKEMLIPQKSSGRLWRPTLMFDIRQRRILYRLSAPDSGNVTPACRWQMGGLGVWRWPHPLPLYGSARRNVLSPSPRPSFLLIILPFLFLSAQSHLTSPLSDLLSLLYPTLPAFFFFNLYLLFAGPRSVCVRVAPVSMETDK